MNYSKPIEKCPTEIGDFGTIKIVERKVMKKIILKELFFNETNIKFKNGMNYIVGSNGSGKTTIYNVIQFVLGLKKEMQRTFTNSSISNPITLSCKIGDREVVFQRSVNSEYISIQYGNTNESVKYMSGKLKEIYDFLFEPFFVYENEKGAAYDIIKYSFLSEIKFDISRGRIESLKKLLGVNVTYMKQATIDYQELKSNIQNERKSIELLEEFINRIHLLNNKDQKVDSEKLKELLEYEYKVIIEKYKRTLEFLELAEKTLIDREEYLDEYLDKRISYLEQFYWKLTDRIGIKRDSNSFRNFFKMRPINRTSSGSQLYLEFLCFMLTLTRNINDEYHNGCGLLINDLPLIDFGNKNNIEKALTSEKDINIQYIEFTSSRKELSKESVIYDLDSLERFI